MMFLTCYETIYILKPHVTNSFNLFLINYYKCLLKLKGAINIIVANKGKRYLSYNILYSYEGIYIQMNYQANGKLLKYLEKSMRFNNNIIRYLTVKLDMIKNI
uniref:30S ribosomal protein S6, chloroplastic n=1 Tax=Choreocolax polysiphoniae TaxID=282351 RepID=A0A0B5VQJ0_9FLOR|nr:30S ribosomal protein S6 [Choreocolax polysiphoniae]AJH65877.1 30S ribosomal protein S6 [Choreocolax polysiphoniae]